MTIRYDLELPPYSAEFTEQVVQLCFAVFDEIAHEYVTWRMLQMPDVSVCYAAEGVELVGFKIGYAMTESRYYSWLGGVHPDYRRRGIASELMRRQHQWLAERGYPVVETAANQTNQAMIQANLSHGFTICGIRTDVRRTQVLFSRSLQPSISRS